MVVLPLVRLAKPVILATLMTVPPDCVRLATVPPVRLAVPVAETVRLPRMALAVKFPEVTLERPVTLANPPVRFVVPQDEMVPIVPAVMLAVAPD